jgi:hypothetical protein
MELKKENKKSLESKITSGVGVNLMIPSIIFFATLLIILIPISFLWSLNTLFSTDLDYNIETWLASFLFLSFFSGMAKSHLDKG